MPLKRATLGQSGASQVPRRRSSSSGGRHDRRMLLARRGFASAEAADEHADSGKRGACAAAASAHACRCVSCELMLKRSDACMVLQQARVRAGKQ